MHENDLDLEQIDADLNEVRANVAHGEAQYNPWALQALHAAEQLRAAVAELSELRSLFELQQERMAEATARWRAEDPEARSLTLPDLGALLQWLMNDADRAREDR